MGALENITERIKKDTSSKANSQINEAKKEAEEILARAKEEFEKEKAQMELETEKVIKIQKTFHPPPSHRPPPARLRRWHSRQPSPAATPTLGLAAAYVH